MAATGWLLKVLSGPHIGAEIELAPGEYLLGSGAECDVLFADGSMAETHARIRIGAEGFEVVELDKSFEFNGETRSKASLRSGETGLLAFGTTLIGVGAAGTDWATVVVEEWLGRSSAREAGGGGEEPAQTLADREPAAAPSPSSGRPRRLGRIAVGLAVLLAAAATAKFFPAWIEALQWQGGGAVEADRRLTPEEVASFIRGLGLCELREVTPNGRQLRATGYCADAEETSRLTQGVAERFGPQVTVEFRFARELLEAAQTTLGALRAEGVGVEYLGSGRLRVSGYVEDSAAAEVLVDLLRTDVAGIREVEADLRIREEIEREVRKRLMDTGLIQWLKLSPTREGVLVKGLLGSLEYREWQKILDEFNSRFGGRIVLFSEVEEEQVTVDLHVQSVSLGTVPYLITTDGKRYLEGARTPQGYVIEKISKEMIVFRRGNRSLTYHVGGG